MVCGNTLFAGQLDGGNADGVATRALLANVTVVKQLAMLMIGTSLKAQLAGPPPVFHTGYLPVIIRLLVKTNPYIGAVLIVFPAINIVLVESGIAGTVFIVMVLSRFLGHSFMIS